ncbi:MAG: superoxide dismutase [Bacteroidetes bacterium]|nr:superoxide dismutase [Bacteroidota bacterium]
MIIFKSLIICIIVTITGVFTINAQSKFELPQLGYAYDALEPVIDAQTMQIHHSKHHQTYVNNLNKALEGTAAENLSIEEIIKNISQYSTAVRNNAGGHYNHSLFWTILTPNKNTQPSERLIQAINQQFGSVDSLKKLLNNAASNQFGSGWAWLSLDKNNKLFISSTSNQDNPLMDLTEKQGRPILGIDVWEHAYYLKYQNKRGDYLLAIWDVINWDEVSKRFETSE